jgi:hypothetical protein
VNTHAPCDMVMDGLVGMREEAPALLFFLCLVGSCLPPKTFEGRDASCLPLHPLPHTCLVEGIPSEQGRLEPAKKAVSVRPARGAGRPRAETQVGPGEWWVCCVPEFSLQVPSVVGCLLPPCSPTSCCLPVEVANAQWTMERPGLETTFETLCYPCHHL